MSHEQEAIAKRPEDKGRAERIREGRAYIPSVDILQLEGELLLEADLPGVNPQNLDIRYEGKVLTLEGRVEPREPENARPILSEYGVGDFHRTFQVGDSIDAEKISAEYKDGVAYIHLPLVTAAKPRKVEIKAI